MNISFVAWAGSSKEAWEYPTLKSVPIRKVLIANRGEVAVRIVRACRSLGIETVAVYSTVDRTERFVLLATEAVCIGEPEAHASYLNQGKIISAAKATGADAIHPGYGFLSENCDFAEACEDAGVAFIGMMLLKFAYIDLR